MIRVIRGRMKRAALALALAAAACGKSGSADKPAPPKPPTGAPVAVQVTKLEKGKVEVDLYDFSDKAVAGYGFLFRYYDKDGKIITLQKGTPFEGPIDHMSVSGRDYMCEPHKWTHFTVDMLNTPPEAVKADALVDMVRSTDGTKVEDLWRAPPSVTDEWPVK